VKDNKELITEAFIKGISAGNPEALVSKKLKKLNKNDFCPSHFLSIGKAATSMAQAVIKFNASIPGIILTNDDNFKKIKGYNCYKAGHPIPDKRGYDAYINIKGFLNKLKKGDHLILLISGGGSALLPAPAEGISLENKIRINKVLLNSGLDINKVNAIRRLFSSFKGGKMALIASPAKITQLLISDVPGDNLESIASGIASPDPIPLSKTIEYLKKIDLFKEVFVKKFLEKIKLGKIKLPLNKNNTVFNDVSSYILASNSLCKNTIKSFLLKNFNILDEATPKLEGEASLMGEKLANWSNKKFKSNSFIVIGGETTVTITENNQKNLGGRSQEVALSFAINIFERNLLTLPWIILSAGTDGKDGPTDAAGAIISSNCIFDVSNAKKYLKNHNSYNFLKKTGSLLKLEPTGTNLGDIVIIIFGK